MILGLALPARVVIEEGLLCGRCGIDADSLAAPRLDSRARREAAPHARVGKWNHDRHMSANCRYLGAVRRL